MVFTVLKVAVTGSIASGKSTVRKILERLGAYTVDADQILHQAFIIDNPLGRQVIALFGESVAEHGVIQRAAISKIVLNRPDLLDKLEDLCHPYVNSMVLKHYAAAGKSSLFVAEMPLLFESKYPMRDWFDIVVLTVADRERALSRFSDRKRPVEQYSFLEGRQLSPDEKSKMADIVLENNGDLQTIESKVKSLFDLLCTLQASKHFGPRTITGPSL